MTSKLTRERPQEIAEDGFLKHGEGKELARMALAAMDSEPVAGEARFKEERPRWTPCTAEHVSMVLANPEDWPNYEVRYLYAAPQPAPVVPEAMPTYAISPYSGAEYEAGYRDGWNACRAAMLQESKKSAGAEATCRSNENAQVLNTIKAPPALDSLPKTGEVQNTDSPVIPDGYVMVPVEPTKEILDEFDSIIDYGAEDSVDAWHRLLAAAPQEVKGE
ncbi:MULTISPECIES: hypothetical protein [Klebsiella pneumoniae complex]|uniref:hypothetical protein n=1 Tax=Klebsiella pneumoniae complex TaxID=3390273 RepID=UPI000E2C8D21|nr:hypothetical protein [Klebsiella variicola]SXF84400.1 Uncharacterised protein [Klebsiella variicola]